MVAMKRKSSKSESTQSILYLIDIHHLIVAHKRRSFLILKPDTSTPGLRSKPICALDDPQERNDRKCKCGPMDESGSFLVGEDRPEGPRDRDGCREITLRGGECVGGGGGFEEQER